MAVCGQALGGSLQGSVPSRFGYLFHASQSGSKTHALKMCMYVFTPQPQTLMTLQTSPEPKTCCGMLFWLSKLKYGAGKVCGRPHELSHTLLTAVSGISGPSSILQAQLRCMPNSVLLYRNACQWILPSFLQVQHCLL